VVEPRLPRIPHSFLACDEIALGKADPDLAVKKLRQALVGRSLVGRHYAGMLGAIGVEFCLCGHCLIRCLLEILEARFRGLRVGEQGNQVGDGGECLGRCVGHFVLSQGFAALKPNAVVSSPAAGERCARGLNPVFRISRSCCPPILITSGRRQNDRIGDDATKQVRDRPALDLRAAFDFLENLLLKMNTRAA
jgi:hypothetical protein